MRKVIVSNLISLDGFIAGPNGEIDWFGWDEELESYCRDQLGSMDTILFGRVTYELMAGYWPAASATENDQAIIDAMNNLPKVVFSRTLDRVEWKNSRLVKDDIEGEVARMKREPGKDMVIFGSGSIVSSLAPAGLIDEYRIFVNPVVLGRGKSMFRGIDNRLGLKHLCTRTFGSGLVLICYEPAERSS
ncbi:MAG: dihydrofolate reductase family protein [Thermodesulfobacteriota bacterium]